MIPLIMEQPPFDPTAEVMQVVRDSTLGTSSMSVVGGYGMGCVFSLFGTMISAETSTQSLGAKHFFAHSLRSAHRLGANFAFFGFVFTGMEVALEKRRGRKDIWNPTISGAVLGAGFGWRSYRRVGLVGGFAGGAVASIIIEKLMDSLMGGH